jgi:PIN domain
MCSHRCIAGGVPPLESGSAHRSYGRPAPRVSLRLHAEALHIRPACRCLDVDNHRIEGSARRDSFAPASVGKPFATPRYLCDIRPPADLRTPPLRARSSNAPLVIVFDTNVVSALMRRKSDPKIVAWLDELPAESEWTTAVTIFEVRFGLALLVPSRRRRQLEEAFARSLEEDLEQRILPLECRKRGGRRGREAPPGGAFGRDPGRVDCRDRLRPQGDPCDRQSGALRGIRDSTRRSLVIVSASARDR